MRAAPLTVPPGRQKLRRIPYWDVCGISFTVNSCTLTTRAEMGSIKFLTLEVRPPTPVCRKAGDVQCF
jgi:hypothetical protein